MNTGILLLAVIILACNLALTIARCKPRSRSNTRRGFEDRENWVRGPERPWWNDESC